MVCEGRVGAGVLGAPPRRPGAFNSCGHPARPLPLACTRFTHTPHVHAFTHTCAHMRCMQVLATFASLTYMPEQGSMAAYVAAMQPKLATATPAELAISLKALARLHFLPTRAWLAEWLASARRCAARLPACLGPSTCTRACACARLVMACTGLACLPGALHQCACLC